MAEPCAVILFGASGDLAKRKVIPALYDLAAHNSLGPRYAIVGFARTPMIDEAFRTTAGDAARSISEVGPIDPKGWSEFASNLYYSAGDYGDQEAYARLAKRLAELEADAEGRIRHSYGVGLAEGEAAGKALAEAQFCDALERLAVAISEGKSLYDAVLYANKAASIAVTRMGAQASAPYRHEMHI